MFTFLGSRFRANARKQVRGNQKTMKRQRLDTQNVCYLNKMPAMVMTRCIGPYLDIRSLLAFVWSMRLCHEFDGVQLHLRRARLAGNLAARELAQASVHGPGLIEALKEANGGAVLAGGFMTRCAMPEDMKWGLADLDIYVAGQPAMDAIRKWMDGKDREVGMEWEKLDLGAYAHIKDAKILELFSSSTLDFPMYHHFEVMKVEQIEASIRAFDLACCRITFNGRLVTVYDVPSILSRSIVDLPPDSSLTLAQVIRRQCRVSKYSERGFTFPDGMVTPRGNVKMIDSDLCRFDLEGSVSHEMWLLRTMYETLCTTRCSCRRCATALRRFTDNMDARR